LRDAILENISLDLLTIFPLIRRSTPKKLIKRSQLDLAINITPLHFEVMRLLGEYGSLRVATIGEKLNIAKAQMSQILNKLVDLNLVERRPDLGDRRVTNVRLTRYGKKVRQEFDRSVRESIQDSLSRLSEKELEELSDALKKLQQIITRLS
jgi:DNA-binding MarR family transcriptional regulator